MSVVTTAPLLPFNPSFAGHQTFIGPYGSGKSAFCVQLAGLLGRAVPGAFAALEHTDPSLWKRLTSPEHRLIPVLVVGTRQPMNQALVEGLYRSLQCGGYTTLLDRLRELETQNSKLETQNPKVVAHLYECAARLARCEGAGGLLLIVDEMGKLLEYAAQHPSESDIFVLQELAEAAARSRDAALLVLTVLHLGADAYAHRLGRADKAEWAKVEERFREVAFFPSDIEQLDMVGRALQRAPTLRPNSDFDRLSRRWAEMNVPHAGLRERFPQLASAAYPLHPLALLALPTLLRKTGQSYRSLFNFLSGEEPHAFGRFLRETPFEAECPPLYTLDMLFDYASEVLIGRWSSGSLTHLWAEAVESVERAVHLTVEARRALKCIALLGLLKDPRLPATREVLALALDGASPEIRNGATAPNVHTILETLSKRRWIAYSPLRGVYRLTEWSSIDVEAELEAARRGLPAGTTLHVAAQLCPPPRLIARRHSYRTGAVRVVNGHPFKHVRVSFAGHRTAPGDHGGQMRLRFASAGEEAV